MKISALILTGGKSSRFGSDKSLAYLNGKSLVQHILDSIPPEWPVVIVGPSFASARAGMTFTLEEPPGGGPVSGLAAGLKCISTENVAVIATDMPYAGQVVRALAEIEFTGDGLIPKDNSGFRQTLCALYRVKPLLNALSAIGQPEGTSMRNLISQLNIQEIFLGEEITSNLLDIDTPEDLKRARGEEFAMDEWIDAVKKELGVLVELDTNGILDVARDAAHAVERKAAPVTTFLLGYAIAQGADPKHSIEKISRLAKDWPTSE